MLLMLKILVAVEDYVNLQNTVAHKFVHVRNIYYKDHGIDVTVLNFRANENYQIDGIKVITLRNYENKREKYNILICHQANLKHHYLFLRKHKDEFEKLIFFFHGHEVLYINKVYAEPYEYMKKSYLKNCLQNIYDNIKLRIWKGFYSSVSEKSKFVFVSKWMLDEFLKWVKIPYSVIEKNTTITYNCIGKDFENSIFDINKHKNFDFITIRSNLDGSKYCIDVVNKLAVENPECKFLVIGKGDFFKYYSKAKNITWLNTTLNHKEIIRFLNESRCALMPTRTDAQGLMMCEMASIGMPLITSDIPVCHEVFSDFENVKLIKNNNNYNLKAMLNNLEKGLPYKKNNKYFNCNTSAIELNLILNTINKKG